MYELYIISYFVDMPGTYLSSIFGLQASTTRPKLQWKQGSLATQVYRYITWNNWTIFTTSIQKGIPPHCQYVNCCIYYQAILIKKRNNITENMGEGWYMQSNTTANFYQSTSTKKTESWKKQNSAFANGLTPKLLETPSIFQSPIPKLRLPTYLPLESEPANPPPTSLSHRPPLATTNLALSTGISSCWCDFRILCFCPKQDVHSRAILYVKERSPVKTLLGKKKPVVLSCILVAISKSTRQISGQITIIPRPEPSGHFGGPSLTFFTIVWGDQAAEHQKINQPLESFAEKSGSSPSSYKGIQIIG